MSQGYMIGKKILSIYGVAFFLQYLCYFSFICEDLGKKDDISGGQVMMIK